VIVAFLSKNEHRQQQAVDHALSFIASANVDKIFKILHN